MQRRQSGGNLGALNLRIADILSDAKQSSNASKSMKKGKAKSKDNNTCNMIYFPEIVGNLPKVAKIRDERSPPSTKTSNFYKNKANSSNLAIVP